MHDDRDVVTFERFFADHERRLRAALSATYGPEVGREAAAEAWAWAYEHWDRVRTLDRPIGYLFRVGQSRSRRIRRRPPLIPVHPDAAMPAIEPALLPALRQLSDRQRAVVVLVVGYGWTQSEVATLLGIRATSVANHLSRGMARLRIELGGDTDGR